MLFANLSQHLVLSALLFISSTSGAPSSSNPSNSPGSMEVLGGNCLDYQIPVTTQTEALIWGLPKFTTNYDASAFILSLIRRPSPTIPFTPFSGSKNVTGNYTIGATFCSPKESKDGHEKTVLLATHGLGFDRR